MKILIVEDSKERQKIFIENIGKLPYSNEVAMFDNSRDAIDALKKIEFNIVSLDFDLGESQKVVKGKLQNVSNGSGGDVSLWMKKNMIGSKSFPVVFLHSLNPAGVKRMKQDLPSAIVKPFSLDWNLE